MSTANGRARRSASSTSVSRSSRSYSVLGRNQSGWGRRHARDARRAARSGERVPVVAQPRGASQDLVGGEDGDGELDEARASGAGDAEGVRALAAEVGTPVRRGRVVGRPRDERRDRRVDDVAQVGEHPGHDRVDAEAPGAERRGRDAETVAHLRGESGQLRLEQPLLEPAGIHVGTGRCAAGPAPPRRAASSTGAGARLLRPSRRPRAAPERRRRRRPPRSRS